MNKKISDLMLEEHERLEKFLNNFTESLDNDFNKAKDAFNILKWNLEKHMFVEEKAIFSLFEKITGEDSNDTFQIMQEHQKEEEMIKNIENKLNNNEKPEVSEFVEFLKNHILAENEFFYPKLDSLLNNQQRQELAERVEEILRG